VDGVVVRRTNALNGRLRTCGKARIDDGQRDREINAVAQSVGKERNRLIDLQIDAVRGCDQILLDVRIGRSRIVLEDARDVVEIDSIQAVEAEVLIRESEKHLVLTDGFRAFGEDRSEARRRSRIDSERRIERIGEARRRRRNRQRVQLAGKRAVEGREV